MDLDDDHVSQQVAADAAADLGSLSCSISERSSAARPASSTGNGSAGGAAYFQAELLAHVQTGHRGLEAALQLLCERLLDLEGCWERAREEHNAKYLELHRECLATQKNLSGLNDDVRQGLRNLEQKVDQLALAHEPGVEAPLAHEPGVEEGGASTPDSPSNDAEASDCCSVDRGGDATIREELLALKTKVDIIAANVLGEGESDSIGTPSPEEKEPHNKDGEDESLKADDVDSAEGITSTDVENNTESRSPCEPQGEALAEKNSPRQEREGTGSSMPRLLPQRVKARSNWSKVRTNRAFLVKKIRRQVMAERKVSQSETIVTRVERLEQALGVNVYTTGSGRLDALAREVRLSLNMLVEHQARAASDNLSAPLCLFPARAGDISLVSAASTLASPPEPYGSSSDTNGRTRTNSHHKRLSNRDGVVGDNGDCVGGWSNGADSSSRGLSGKFCGDVGRLWMSEDGGYLCVDLLLERTLEEFAEGLAFAASRVEQVRLRGTSGSSDPIGRASVSKDVFHAGGIGATTRELMLASFKNEDDEEGSVVKMKREIERMQDRCARLAVLLGRLGAAHQREQKGGGRGGGRDGDGDGEKEPEQLFTEPGEAEQQRQKACFAAEESEERGTTIPQSEAVAAITSEVLRLSCALAGDLQYLLSRPVYCRVLENFSFSPGRKCLCGRNFDVHHGNTAAASTANPAPTTTTAAAAAGKTGTGCGPLSRGDFVGGEGGTGGCATEHTHRFRVRPTLYQCFVFSLGHLSSFLATARSRSSHRAVSSLSSLTGELQRGVLTAGLAAREAVAAAAAAQKVARHASAEALEATVGAAAAAASARNEGSFLLEELHRQLANAMRTERDRTEQDKDERARADRKKSQLLETQLGQLKALLDSKAGQEDVTAITQVMGDVEETLAVVRQSIPGQSAMLELQEALSRKADKAYTKRTMALLVSRVSALLKDESDEPSMAKKCLSCDRAFNKFSFEELQQLPNVLESVVDAAVSAPQKKQERQVAAGADSPDAGREGERAGWQRETPADGGRTGSPGARARQEATRPGSAPSARPSTLEQRSSRNNRPSSAAPHRLGRGVPGGFFRPDSGGAHPRSARAVGGTPRVLPPAGSMTAAGSQSASQLFSPTALSATYRPLSEGARKAVEAEAARAGRSSAREPSPAPDHLRYGGMTQAPLVRQLFAGFRGASGKAVANTIVLSRGGRGGTAGSTGFEGRGGEGRGGGVVGGRPPLGGSGEPARDGFSSTLEHHRQNVISVTVPPVKSVAAGGFVPGTLIRGNGGGGSGSGTGSATKPKAA